MQSLLRLTIAALVVALMAACAEQRSGERPRPGPYAGVTLGGTR